MHCIIGRARKRFDAFKFIVLVYLLEDVPPGAGGLIIVPASHKANMSHTPALDSRVVENPAGRAGDLLVFTVSPPALPPASLCRPNMGYSYQIG